MKPYNRTVRAVLLLSAALAVSAPARAQDLRRIATGGADTIAVSVTGRGAPVVIVPGLLGSRYAFRHVEAALAAGGHRVIIADPLGTGESSRHGRSDYSLEAQARRVVAVMDSLGVDDAILVCHSVGASICLRLALFAPDRVQGVVSVNGGPDERAATSGLRTAMKFAPLIRIMGSRSMRGRIRDGLHDSAGPDATWVTEDAVAAYTAPFADLGATLDALKGMASAREPEPLASRLSRLAAPVVLLVATGNPDGGVAPADVATLSQLPDLRIDSIAGAGQYIQEEKPGAIVAAVRSLRDRLAALGSR